ncbi:unnamed protein product [Ostreobium quekettii]|uniref:Uncharacterized protein n=1 Tax=Ostreobium quekettii TaxID=121088 RepID=A0A8S1IYW6_9CHLO|nr:unnamed protein product [Ostreobium quekettii]|eukprot:evm.model.scf_2141.3 EVM.evm.TU.scf_2141.3   scf_2141:17693-24047(-)
MTPGGLSVWRGASVRGCEPCSRSGTGGRIGAAEAAARARRVLGRPDFEVRGARQHPSREECKVVAAQMMCKESQKRNRSFKAAAYRTIVEQFFPGQPQAARKDAVVTLDTWRFSSSQSRQPERDTAQEYVDDVYAQMLEEFQKTQEAEELVRQKSTAARKEFKRNARLLAYAEGGSLVRKAQREVGEEEKLPRSSYVHCYYRYFKTPHLALSKVAEALGDPEDVWDAQDENRGELSDLDRLKSAQRRSRSRRLEIPESELEDERHVEPLYRKHLFKHLR